MVACRGQQTGNMDLTRQAGFQYTTGKAYGPQAGGKTEVEKALELQEPRWAAPIHNLIQEV
jgi:hypothetical protein